jgi:hypothetical protein
LFFKSAKHPAPRKLGSFFQNPAFDFEAQPGAPPEQKMTP